MPLKLAPREVIAQRRGDTWYLESPSKLAPCAMRLGDLLRSAAEKAAERDFLIERRDGALVRLSWGKALRAAEGIAAWLVREQPRDARVVALSGNSVHHALLMLGCYLAGVPFAPVSPAYSLASRDYVKLLRVVEKVRPAVVYVEDDAPFGAALEVLRTRASFARLDRNELASIATTQPSDEARDRESRVLPDQTAKFLFTSGSTGLPKGVPNTHRMLCLNQQMISQCWPFLSDGPPPVLVDWLPWSHTFGGNHNFNLVLFHGGTLLVDEGKPAPGAVDATLANLRELPPTLYFNVPAGYSALIPRLEADDALARAFFSRLDVVFYAAAALPDELWKRIGALAQKHAPHEVFLTTAWGSTETSPLATSAHFALDRAGNIGLPAPGITLKLVPNGSKLEVRVKGPTVTEGYLDEPELTRDAFDDEGFYRMGDAIRFANEERPEEGLVFDGRVAEDFKLSSGTWVSVTHVRTGVVGAARGLVADAVVCGHDRAALGLLLWPSPAGCSAFSKETSLTLLAQSDAIKGEIARVLEAWNRQNPASSMRISRALLLEEPPSIDAGEITDKGYTNQRAVVERRSATVEELFAEPPSPRILVL